MGHLICLLSTFHSAIPISSCSLEVRHPRVRPRFNCDSLEEQRAPWTCLHALASKRGELRLHRFDCDYGKAPFVARDELRKQLGAVAKAVTGDGIEAKAKRLPAHDRSINCGFDASSPLRRGRRDRMVSGAPNPSTVFERARGHGLPSRCASTSCANTLSALRTRRTAPSGCPHAPRPGSSSRRCARRARSSARPRPRASIVKS